MYVRENLAAVQAKVQQAAEKRGKKRKADELQPVRLVAVSKTMSPETLMEAYDAGQRHFGENYVEEIVEKAPFMPEDVQWHFIGKLQSEKASKLIKGCPSLACIESVDNEKLAREIDKAWLAEGRNRKLRVMAQVHSEDEAEDPGACLNLCKIIAAECEGLQLAGLMTIGAPDYSGCRKEDFEILYKCRDEVAAAIGVDPESLEMSMGMSSDFENAIVQGSSSVRVGSSIFGSRVFAFRPVS